MSSEVKFEVKSYGKKTDKKWPQNPPFGIENMKIFQGKPPDCSYRREPATKFPGDFPLGS